MELYRVYGEDFMPHVIEEYKPSNEYLVQRLELTHMGLETRFEDWLERNP